MIATAAPTAPTYPSGRVYSLARGRYAPRRQLEDRIQVGAAVVEGRPNCEKFVAQIVREMRIRFYQPKTVKSYRNALKAVLRWFGGPARGQRE